MDDLIAEFITETNESISELDTEIVRLEQNPDDYDLMNNIFRLMHTIKGTCGFLGLERLQGVAHSGENVLDKLRNKELTVTSEAVSFILESIDQIKEILEVLDETGVEPQGDDSVLIAKLDAFAEGGDAPAPAAEAAPADDGADEHGFTPVMAGDTSTPEVEPDEHGFVPVPAGGNAEEPDEHGFVPVPAGGNVEPEADEHGFVPVPAEEAAPEPEEETAAVAKAAANEPEESAKKVAIDEGLKAKTETAPAAAKKPTSTGSIRVGIDVLENLMQLVSELVLTRNQLIQVMRKTPGIESEFTTGIQRLSHITSDLQEGVMQTRMQPIGGAWNKLPRIIRDLSIELEKKIDLKMIGEETELDRQLLELIRDPLTHMIRNSADHGVETPDIRTAAGKPETGTIVLSAFHEGGHIIVEIKDDGAGIDPEIIGAKAVEKGLATAEEVAAMDDRQIFRFIFAAGFSTAAAVTSVSGRGVGMDVVRTNIEKMGGSIDLDSKKGEGSTFQMKIPLTLAIMPVLIMEVANEKFAIPQINVLELVLSSGDSDHRIEKVNDSPVLRLRGRLLPLIDLSGTLGLDGLNANEEAPYAAPQIEASDSNEEHADGTTEVMAPEKDNSKQFIVVCELGSMSFGLIVDRIFDTEEIVVKPVSKALKNIVLYSGSTILGDGSVIMILDPNGLAQSVNLSASAQSELQEDVISDEDKPVPFLMFKSGEGAPKAVPLELVSRLEEVKLSEIERAGSIDVLQYRGSLMRIAGLKTSFNYKELDAEKVEVIVFNDAGRVLGLAVENILDIVEEKIENSFENAEGDYLGSMVIEDTTTDIIDVSKLFDESFSDWKTEGRISPDTRDGRLKEKILLVEDSPFFRKLMVPILSSKGYLVVTASNGLEAAKTLNREPDFDVIITDIEMPEMNGFEFAEACMGDANIKHIPIIALTSTENASYIKKAREIGISYYVNKSDREKLFEAVVDLLSSKETVE